MLEYRYSKNGALRILNGPYSGTYDFLAASGREVFAHRTLPIVAKYDCRADDGDYHQNETEWDAGRYLQALPADNPCRALCAEVLAISDDCRVLVEERLLGARAEEWFKHRESVEDMFYDAGLLPCPIHNTMDLHQSNVTQISSPMPDCDPPLHHIYRIHDMGYLTAP